MSSSHVSDSALEVPSSHALRWIAAAAVAGIVLAVLGPFGSYLNGGPVARAGYWVSAMLIGLVLYGVAFMAAKRVAPLGTHAGWPVLIGATLIASVPEALIARAEAFWLWPELASLGLSWPLWYAQTATIGVVNMMGGVFALHRSPVMPQEKSTPSPVMPAPARPLSGEVLALQMEDHYVRVHTAQGSELILMPLGRAIEAVSAEGLQTHRSWWVARHAVATVEGTPRAMRLHLSNGVVAPVARSAVVYLKAAGWIAT